MELTVEQLIEMGLPMGLFVTKDCSTHSHLTETLAWLLAESVNWDDAYKGDNIDYGYEKEVEEGKIKYKVKHDGQEWEVEIE